MIQILVDVLYQELDDYQLENTSSHPGNLQQLIEEKNNIGWDHLVNRKIEVTMLNSGTEWIRMLTKSIWNNINQVWIDRNLARHGKDEEEQREKMRLHCISEITEYYNYRDDGKLQETRYIVNLL